MEDTSTGGVYLEDTNLVEVSIRHIYPGSGCFATPGQALSARKTESSTHSRYLGEVIRDRRCAIPRIDMFCG